MSHVEVDCLFKKGWQTFYKAETNEILSYKQGSHEAKQAQNTQGVTDKPSQIYRKVCQNILQNPNEHTSEQINGLYKRMQGDMQTLTNKTKGFWIIIRWILELFHCLRPLAENDQALHELRVLEKTLAVKLKLFPQPDASGYHTPGKFAEVHKHSFEPFGQGHYFLQHTSKDEFWFHGRMTGISDDVFTHRITAANPKEAEKLAQAANQVFAQFNSDSPLFPDADVKFRNMKLLIKKHSGQQAEWDMLKETPQATAEKIKAWFQGPPKEVEAKSNEKKDQAVETKDADARDYGNKNVLWIDEYLKKHDYLANIEKKKPGHVYFEVVKKDLFVELQLHCYEPNKNDWSLTTLQFSSLENLAISNMDFTEQLTLAPAPLAAMLAYYFPKELNLPVEHLKEGEVSLSLSNQKVSIRYLDSQGAVKEVACSMPINRQNLLKSIADCKNVIQKNPPTPTAPKALVLPQELNIKKIANAPTLADFKTNPTKEIFFKQTASTIEVYSLVPNAQEDQLEIKHISIDAFKDHHAIREEIQEFGKQCKAARELLLGNATRKFIKKDPRFHLINKVPSALEFVNKSEAIFFKIPNSALSSLTINYFYTTASGVTQGEATFESQKDLLLFLRSPNHENNLTKLIQKIWQGRKQQKTLVLQQMAKSNNATTNIEVLKHIETPPNSFFTTYNKLGVRVNTHNDLVIYFQDVETLVTKSLRFPMGDNWSYQKVEKIIKEVRNQLDVQRINAACAFHDEYQDLIIQDPEKEKAKLQALKEGEFRIHLTEMIKLPVMYYPFDGVICSFVLPTFSVSAAKKVHGHIQVMLEARELLKDLTHLKCELPKSMGNIVPADDDDTVCVTSGNFGNFKIFYKDMMCTGEQKFRNAELKTLLSSIEIVREEIKEAKEHPFDINFFKLTAPTNKEIPPGPDVDINILVKIFDVLKFGNNIRKGEIPETKLENGTILTKAVLRAELTDMLDTIQGKKETLESDYQFRGIPKNPQAKDEFYQNLIKVLKHITFELIKHSEIENQPGQYQHSVEAANHLIMLCTASAFCGGSWKTAAYQCYSLLKNEMCLHDDEAQEDDVVVVSDRLLEWTDLLKVAIVDEMVMEGSNKQNAHEVPLTINTVNEIIAMPLSEAMAYPDKFKELGTKGKYNTPEKVKQGFISKFNPYTLFNYIQDKFDATWTKTHNNSSSYTMPELRKYALAKLIELPQYEQQKQEIEKIQANKDAGTLSYNYATSQITEFLDPILIKEGLILNIDRKLDIPRGITRKGIKVLFKEYGWIQ